MASQGGREALERRVVVVSGGSNTTDPSQLRQRVQEFLTDNRIVEQLWDKTINPDIDTGRFITHPSLQIIWHNVLIAQFLQILGYSGDQNLVNKTAKDLIKTISILVAIRWYEWERFGELFFEYRSQRAVRHDRKDGRLPHPRSVLGERDFLGGLWAPSFYHEQRVYLPLIIEEGGNAIFPRDRPIPFILSETSLIAQGGYGTVTKEAIAPYQFIPLSQYQSKDPLRDKVYVARKWFQARGDFSKEARNLAKFNNSLSHHTRIVKYLAMFTIGQVEDRWASKEFNILLPLADTDLKKFLYDPQFSSRFSELVPLVEEASNLADAIRWLHAGLMVSNKMLFVCHMDLKLDNVLVYFNPPSVEHPPAVGWWKISDFGISSMTERQQDASSSQRQATTAMLEVPSPANSLARITGTVRASVHRPAGPYSAPESEQGNLVGPKADVFSFGCMLFQVLARGAGGIELLESLDEQRGTMENGSTNDHFCQRSGGQMRLHPSVTAWLKDRHSLGEGSFPERAVVMDCKLLIEKTLDINYTSRPTAEKVHQKLVKIANGQGGIYNFDRNGDLIIPQPRLTKGRANLQPAPSIEVTEDIEPLSATSQSFVDDIVLSPPVSTDDNVPRTFQVTPIVPQRPPTPPPEPQEAIPSPPDGAQVLGPVPQVRPPLIPNQEPFRPTLPAKPPRTNSEPFGGLTASPAQLSDAIFMPRPRHDSQQTLVPKVQGREDERGELIPFQVENVIMTLISSTRAKIVFVSGKEAVAYTLYNPYSRKTIPAPANYAWDSGSLAGDFLVLGGYCKEKGRRTFHFYKLSISDKIIGYDEIHRPENPLTFDKFAVSRDGKLILGASKKIWLCQSFNGQAKELDTSSTKTGHLQQVWFSTHGLLAFARFSLPGNLHRVRIWDVAQPDQVTGTLDYQVPPGDISTTPIKNTTHFPQSAACFLWLEHHRISILQHIKTQRSSPSRSQLRLTNLQAIVVTPNEKAVVIIRSHKERLGFRSVSKISIAPISIMRINNRSSYKMLGEPSPEVNLKYHLDSHHSCDVVIEEHSSSSQHVRVLIGHCNGRFEIKDMELPAAA